MKTVKVEDSVAEKLKDLKAYLRTREKLSVTETEILSQAFKMAFEQKDELLRRLKRAREAQRDFWKFWMTPAEGGPVTDAARDHDAVEP
ncbi:MAG: hypothetical protein QXM46_04870 [Candidatus Hadarchaeales archaeon]